MRGAQRKERRERGRGVRMVRGRFKQFLGATESQERGGFKDKTDPAKARDERKNNAGWNGWNRRRLFVIGDSACQVHTHTHTNAHICT